MVLERVGWCADKEGMAQDGIDKQGLNPALEVGTFDYYGKQYGHGAGSHERDRYEREKAAKARQEASEDRQREIERHEREKTQLRLNIIALVMSGISLLISVPTAAFVVYDRFVDRPPVGINFPICQTEDLSCPTCITAERASSGNGDSNDGKTDSDTQTSESDGDVHE